MGAATAVAGIGAVASIGGSLLSSSAASSAADTQASAANRSADLVHQQYLQTAANLAPFLNTGQAAFNRLGTIFGLNSGAPLASSPPQATQLNTGSVLSNALGSANTALSGASGGNGQLPPGYMIQPNMSDAGDAGIGTLISQIVTDPQGNVVGTFPPTASPADIAQQISGQTSSAASAPPAAPATDPNASGNALASYGLKGLTYNPSDYGLGNGVFNPAAYGLGNGTYNPANYGLGNGTFDPSKYGLGNGTFQPTQAQLESMPGYQFTRDQGLKSVQNSATARGQGVSGAALKAGAQYATGLADTTVTNEANIFNQNLQNAKGIYGGNLANTQNIFGTNLANAKGIYTGNLANTQGIFQQNLGNVINPLLSYAQLGENAGAQTGAAGSNAVNAQASLLVGGANAQAAGAIGSANALSSGLNTVGQAPLNYMLYQKLLGDGAGSPYAGAPASANPLLYMNPNPGFGDTSYANSGLGAVY